VNIERSLYPVRSPWLSQSQKAAALRSDTFSCPYSRGFVKGVFSDVRQRFIADSSPLASVSALCNTAAGLKAVSPQYATRREEVGED
jgi:hypothetical protein